MAATRSVTLEGLTGRPIEIEVDISSGMPGTVIVGLPDVTVNEARDRCRAAVINSGTSWPDHRVTINLAPSAVPKSGSHFDLAIALAVFAAKKLIPAEHLADAVFLGELALDGRLRAVRGVLPATLAAVQAGFSKVFVPEVNVAEAELVEGVHVIGLRSLGQAVALLTGDDEPSAPPVPPLASPDTFDWSGGERLDGLDLADIAGQDEARLSLIIAAAGGHHLSMTGPPGIGKTMLAQRLPGLLPNLDYADSLSTSAVHSVAGRLSTDSPLVTRPPFLDPHHSASAVSIVGGGSPTIRPGSMSLAHNGVLFLDEAPEFASNVLDALRQPLESGHVVVSRAAQTAAFPARFQLVLASNPCPCGLSSAVSNQCECTPLMRRRYKDRISGPIRDRIDIHRTLNPLSRPELTNAVTGARPSAEIAPQVAAARKRQSERYADTPWGLNSEVPGAELRKYWPLCEQGRSLIDRELRTQKLSARSADRVVRLSWTVADLLDHGQPDVDDVATALSLRRSLPLDGRLLEVVRGT